jgi:serine protease AprX
MQSPTRFTVLIERRLPQLRQALAWSLFLLTALALLLTVPPAQADNDGRRFNKIARDLQGELGAARKPGQRWARDVRGRRHVQLIVVSNSSDAELNDLRRAVLRLGGSVHARHPLVGGLTVQLPADKVDTLSARSDVVSVSPNRDVRRSASVLEASSGVLTSNVRSYTLGGYSGLDGSGIGIAVLDSGVMAAHRSFQNAAGSSRVARNVNLRNANLADWLVGVDSTVSPAPGSSALASYEAAINSGASALQDAYGHGTHVASVAAGRAGSALLDSTGVAPGAAVYDVRVLGDNGQGNLSDVLEGIQWAIFHAREYNIRILNLSLAASSNESWQTDPLCIAVRRASAAGITVVVAAGNFGVTAAGKQAYGTIGSPGNDPSVISVCR